MLLLVRHGRTEANAAGRLLGRSDIPLDDLGRAQAASLAASIESVDRVVSSPLQRTRETAAAFGAPVEVDERLVELDYGDFDGRAFGDLPAGTWEQWRSDPGFTPPGGESLEELGSRVRACLDELAPAAMHGTVVVVSHVSPIKAGVAWALGVSEELSWRLHVSPASITRIDVRGATRVLLTFNETAHLEG
jgi:broad specificity phosphatase PhoE